VDSLGEERRAKKEINDTKDTKSGSDDDKYWVYIVCCSDNTLYTGSTPQLARRLAEHNSGKGAKYTRGRRPVCLAQAWAVENRSQALKLESMIKKQGRRTKEKLVAKPNLLIALAKEKGYDFPIEN
jgi:putative endonuclease